MKKNVFIIAVMAVIMGVLLTQIGDSVVTQTPDQFIAQANTLGIGDHSRALTVDGLKRTYVVHVPKSYDGSQPCPVVLVFHGGGSSSKQAIYYFGLFGFHYFLFRKTESITTNQCTMAFRYKRQLYI